MRLLLIIASTIIMNTIIVVVVVVRVVRGCLCGFQRTTLWPMFSPSPFHGFWRLNSLTQALWPTASNWWAISAAFGTYFLFNMIITNGYWVLSETTFPVSASRVLKLLVWATMTCLFLYFRVTRIPGLWPHSAKITPDKVYSPKMSTSIF